MQKRFVLKGVLVMYANDFIEIGLKQRQELTLRTEAER